MRRKREGGIKAESGSQSDGMEDTPSQSFAEVTEARAEQVQCSGTALRAMGDARVVCERCVAGCSDVSKLPPSAKSPP